MHEAPPGRWPSFAATTFYPPGSDLRLSVVVLAPVAPERLAQLGAALLWDSQRDDDPFDDEESGEPLRSSWWVQRGSAEHHALLCVEPDAPLREIEASVAKLGVPAYVLILSGWDDPDDGYPSITRIEGAEKREVWASGSAEEELEILMDGDESRREWAAALVAGGEAQRDPKIVGPWELARKLGVELPSYRRYDDEPS